MSTPSPSARAPKASQRQLVLLAGLAVVLAGVVMFVLVPGITGGGVTPRAASIARPVAQTAARTDTARRDVVDVHLNRLKVAPPDPSAAARNPFRMGPAPPPPGAAAAAHPGTPLAAPLPAQPMVPVGPPPPPALPPIPYKFIGIVTGNGRTGKIAVLTDGHNVVSGPEGANIEGRYRIVRIGEESIQMEYADGRGRQTIRLSGQ